MERDLPKMKANILIRKKVKARNTDQAMKKIKKKYPRARIITYKFDEDFRYSLTKDYNNRTMTIAFIDDYKNVRLE